MEVKMKKIKMEVDMENGGGYENKRLLWKMKL